MQVRYILRVVESGNKFLKSKLGLYAYTHAPNPEQCTGWMASPRFEYTDDPFKAEFFTTKYGARTAVTRYGASAVTYQLLKLSVTCTSEEVIPND